MAKDSESAKMLSARGDRKLKLAPTCVVFNQPSSMSHQVVVRGYYQK